MINTPSTSPENAEQYARQMPGNTVYSKDSIPGDIPPDAETPSDYIPGLYTLGSTYNVLNGKYADSNSALQQVIDWDQSSLFIRTRYLIINRFYCYSRKPHSAVRR